MQVEVSECRRVDRLVPDRVDHRHRYFASELMQLHHVDTSARGHVGKHIASENDGTAKEGNAVAAVRSRPMRHRKHQPRGAGERAQPGLGRRSRPMWRAGEHLGEAG